MQYSAPMWSLNKAFKASAGIFLAANVNIAANAHEVPNADHTHLDDPNKMTDNVCETGDTPYIAFDLDSGRIIEENRSDIYIQTASMAKIMSQVLFANAVADGDINPHNRVRISDDSIDKGTKWGGNSCDIKDTPRVYRNLDVENARKMSAVRSCNEVTVALAKDIVRDSFEGGDEIPNRYREKRFVEEMNAEAQAMGMHNTNYTNASGLPDPGNHTTLQDLAVQFKHIYDEREDVKSYLSLTETGIRGWNIGNTITLMRNNYIDHDTVSIWGKTGTVAPHRGGAGWILGFEEENGPNIAIATICHPEAKPSKYHIRENFTLEVYERARNFVVDHPNELNQKPDIYGNPPAQRFLLDIPRHHIMLPDPFSTDFSEHFVHPIKQQPVHSFELP